MKNFLEILSDENSTPDNKQRLAVTARYMDDDERPDFDFSVGAQEDFKLHEEKFIQLTYEEMGLLYNFLGQHFGMIATYSVVDKLKDIISSIEEDSKYSL